MPRVREPAWVRAFTECVGNALRDSHASQRQVARVHALREADEVWGDAPAIHGEPLAASTETTHHLVADHHDAVAVADVAYALEVAVRRYEDAVGSHDGLEDDRCDGVCALHHERVLDVLQRSLALLGLVRRVERRPVRVGAPYAHDSRDAWFASPSARVAGHRHRPGCCTVVAAVRGEDLVPTRVNSRHADGVLGCLGAPVGEEHHIEVARGEFGDESRCLTTLGVGERRRDGAQLGGLVLDGLHEFGVLVADVHVDELTREVEVTLAVLVPHPRALGSGNDDGVDESLCRPRMEHVGAVVGLGDRGAGFDVAH
ncbi:unannotated protein [freshwater metagenome]|uniref:Unannotated protein n=1 Tax=freshwater metagenome TaxID=449393 RepID=A0A6J7EW99_9ZZZZ